MHTHKHYRASKVHWIFNGETPLSDLFLEWNS